MRRGTTFLTLLALMGAGCHSALETPQHHIVHPGEMAVLAGGDREDVLVAASRSDVHQLAPAVAANDRATIDRMIAENRAFPVANRTRVKVEGAMYNERKIRVAEGPLEGRVVWVAFEMLEPYRGHQ